VETHLSQCFQPGGRRENALSKHWRDPLLRTLRELGTDHEPDLSAIIRRLDALRRGSATS
jgi:hypothetical protein